MPGLNYLRAPQQLSNWSIKQQLVTGGENGLRPCIAEIAGKPAVAYKYRPIMAQDYLMYIAATDVDGNNWGAVETVDSTHSAGHVISMTEVGGRPAIAYTHNGPGELWFAYRY